MSSKRGFLALVILTQLLGCGGPSSPATAVFVGTAGDDVLAASIWDGDQVLVYTCGVDESLDDTTAWFVGTRDGQTFEATVGDVTLVATREDGTVHGTLGGTATTEDLDLAEVTSLEEAGFFVATDGDCRTAAIAFRRAGVMTVQGAHFCSADGPFFQVTPVLPNEFLSDSLRVSFNDGSGLRELNLERREGI